MRFQGTAVVFTQREAKALLAHAMKPKENEDEPKKHRLKGVWVDYERGRIVATDGHRMLVGYPEGERPKNTVSKLLIPYDSFANAIKHCGSKDQSIAFDGEAKLVIIRRDFGGDIFAAEWPVVIAAEPVNLSMPAIDNVMPPKADGKPFMTALYGLNFRYLADVALVSDAIDEHRGLKRGEVSPSYAMVTSPSDDLAPVRLDFDFPGIARWTAVIMPARI